MAITVANVCSSLTADLQLSSLVRFVPEADVAVSLKFNEYALEFLW